MQGQRLSTLATPVLLAVLALSGSSFAQTPLTSFCNPGVAGVIPCPCSNPPGGPDRGCDNSSATGGASLSASGVAALTADTLVFTSSGQRANATSIVLQASGSNTTGVVFGQGVRCISNNLLRLYVKSAVGDSISAPTGTDLSVSARSSALGGTLSAGQTRNYAVYYRDPVVLGGCAASATYNMTQSVSLTWIHSPPPPVGLVAIQPGTFEMGSAAAGGAPYYGDGLTQPVHPVTLTYNYWMGATEVTQADYQALMGTNPAYFVSPNNPVDRVSWNQAVAYCAALTTQQAALGNVPAGYQFRLPTEAEWEYACRAGTTTEFNTGTALFCNQAKIGWSFHSNLSCTSNNTVAVGSYAPNAWGLYDMHGNVWEWCLDSYAAYTPGAATDPFVTGGTQKVFRGGGWSGNTYHCRTAVRDYDPPTYASFFSGFRVVLAPILIP